MKKTSSNIFSLDTSMKKRIFYHFDHLYENAVYSSKSRSFHETNKLKCLWNTGILFDWRITSDKQNKKLCIVYFFLNNT
jgi:hypothetical protein